MMDLETHAIRSRVEFEGLTSATTGFIVNVDEPTHTTKAHRPACETISVDLFETKVIKNESRNGRYFFFLRLEDAERNLGAVPCGRCLQG
jgi:hypothetical protein